MNFILGKFFPPLPFMENISDFLRRKLRTLFNLVTLPLTFDNSITLHLPYWPYCSSCSFSIFSSLTRFFTSHHSFFDPTLIFDALSIEIPPMQLFHICISHFSHLYQHLLHLVSHHFFFGIFFFIVKAINFFYM